MTDEELSSIFEPFNVGEVEHEDVGVGSEPVPEKKSKRKIIMQKKKYYKYFYYFGSFFN